MKAIIYRFITILATFGITLVPILYLQHNERWLGDQFGFGGLLIWPATLLSLTGFVGSWIVLVIATLGMFLAIAIRIRRAPCLLFALLGAITGVLYPVLGCRVLHHVPAPIPAHTPYDADPANKQIYIGAFADGYLCGIGGTLRTYCFSPEAPTRGFYEGQYLGNSVYYSALGKRLTDHNRRFTELMAARDGVDLNAREEGAEPGGGEVRRTRAPHR